MKWWVLTIGVFGIVGLVNALASRGNDGPEKPILAGARVPIDASRYASLQQAIDALPEEGGVVRIPPGRFRIVEPLAIRQDDVLLVGSGTATHIENVNTSGLPAIKRFVILSLPYATQKIKKPEALSTMFLMVISK